MNDFVKHFDKAVSSVWYLALVAIFVLVYFGSGIYASYSEKHADRVYRAEYAAQFDKCTGGQFCKVVVSGKTYRFLTLSAKEGH
jgi:hypothetical protein